MYIFYKCIYYYKYVIFISYCWYILKIQYEIELYCEILYVLPKDILLFRNNLWNIKCQVVKDASETIFIYNSLLNFFILILSFSEISIYKGLTPHWLISKSYHLLKNTYKTGFPDQATQDISKPLQAKGMASCSFRDTSRSGVPEFNKRNGCKDLKVMRQKQPLDHRVPGCLSP